LLSLSIGFLQCTVNSAHVSTEKRIAQSAKRIASFQKKFLTTEAHLPAARQEGHKEKETWKNRNDGILECWQKSVEEL
jgi:hypothetical protein